MMKMLLGSGLVFPPHDRVAPHVQVFTIPFYQVGCISTVGSTQGCVSTTTHLAVVCVMPLHQFPYGIASFSPCVPACKCMQNVCLLFGQL